MSSTNETGNSDSKGHEQDYSNEALLERSTKRLSALLQQDEEIRRSRPLPEAIAAIGATKSCIEAAALAFELYADRPCMGERAFEVTSQGDLRYLPAFRVLRYSDVWDRVEALASGLARALRAKPGAFFGICGFGSPDWMVADLACLYLALVSVPLQTRMIPADLQQIIRETELSGMICSLDDLDSVAAVLPQCPSIRSIIVMDLRPQDRLAMAAFAKRKQSIEETSGGRVVVRTLLDLEARGCAQGIVPMVLPSARAVGAVGAVGGDDDPLMTLVYTSGSTGTPKGAMFPESLWLRHWHAGFFSGRLPEFPLLTINYMPLNHMAGRGQMMNSIVRGGLTLFVLKSDMSTLFEDIRLARPASLWLVPRVASMIHQYFQAEIVRRRGNRKLNEEEQRRLEQDLMAEMRGSFLGDRLLYGITGSAPTPPEVISFLQRCFQVPIYEGYGTTEAGRITFENRLARDQIDWKLVDVPELGFRATDEPYPRGELHVRTSYLIPGYYKNEIATKDLFDEEGFMNTGDIVEQRAPDCLVWIDRAKNVLKLSQGEFVATSRLEGIYASQSPFIRQVYIYGTGIRSYLLAVVVPAMPAVTARLREQGAEPDDASVKRLIRDEINRIATEEGVHGYEIPRDFLIERAPFTTENGLLTGSNKQSRPKLRAAYGARLDALFDAIERAQLEDLEGLRGEGGRTMSALDKVKKAVQVTLGLGDVEQTKQSFIQLGGDSLSAVTLGALLEEIAGVKVPVGMVLDPTSSIGDIARYIEVTLSGKSIHRNPTFEEIHGKDPAVAVASDLTIEKFLSAEELGRAARSRTASELPREATVVLLTGATGFLGRFLALDLLQRLPAEGGKLHCLVRAPNDAAALERLRASYKTDPALEKRFDELSAKGRLVVHAGDFMKPRFGLANDVYARLAEEVDCVLHNGALVNHALSYAQVFEPNVLGTIEMLRFALEQRIKQLSYVSTVGALSGLDRTGVHGGIREDEDIRTLLPERNLGAGYANGYSTSKWASETLLHDAHEKLGVPVSIFRPSGIMTNREYRGQINVPDFFTRLLAGIVDTGLAPKSFYAEGRGHYDGLPVDVVARSIAAVTAYGARMDDSDLGYATYNVVNPYVDDGVSLDTIIDWMSAAGYPIERVADYAEWFQKFRDRLTSLGESQRRHSPLPILGAWERQARGGYAVVFDDARLLERLKVIAEARGPEDLAILPHVSERLVHKYIADMVALHIIAPPRLRMTGS